MCCYMQEVRQREETIKIWTDMWLGNDTMPMDAIFTEDVVYTECWGNKYNGREEIRRWFADWHKNNSMALWKVSEFIHQNDKTVVKWHMEAESADGITTRALDGLYLVEWDNAGRIRSLEEYGAAPRKKQPYRG